MDRVVIGMDPHKRSVSIEVRDVREVLRATGRFGTDTANYRAMLRVARQWPERVWAVEGANGIGRPIAQRLVADGERVLDVPAKLAARARVFDTGQGRKTDATDAHSIVLVALRDKGLRELSVDPQLMVMRLLCDRRDELSHARAQTLNRLHRLLLEKCLGITEEAVKKESYITYFRERDAALNAVREGKAQIAFLLNPTRLDQLRDIAYEGNVMPQKSTDFYPKVLSGLTMYSLE